MTQVVVTGAGGFIGRPVVARLTSLGYDVRRWTEPLDALARRAGPAYAVVHLASTPRHGPFALKAEAALAVEVAGVEAALDYCRTSGARCIFASTAGVYRTTGIAPQDEEAPTGPDGAYAASKLAAETRCEEASTHFGVRCGVLRLFNVYGPGQRSPFLVPDLLNALATGALLQLKMPEAVRDFVFVDDVAQAFADAVNWPCDGFRVFNIGTGQGTRVTDLVEMAAHLLGRTPRWSTAQAPSDETTFSVADIRRARAELGWEPATTLEAGLTATCAVWTRDPAAG